MERGKVPAFFANLPPWSVGLEASGGAHHRARELQALGHDARLMPPQYVKAYTKTNKHDAADAEECCEAVQRPGMRLVPVKSAAQQATCMLRRVRDQRVGQRTATTNPLRGHLTELGGRGAQRPGRPAPAADRPSANSRTSASRRWPGRSCRRWWRTCGSWRTGNP